MLVLPKILSPLGGVRLPLVDAAARQLEVALLSCPEDRRDAFRQAVREDPLLAAWIACAMAETGRPSASTLTEAALWLAEDPAAKLATLKDKGRGGMVRPGRLRRLLAWRCSRLEAARCKSSDELSAAAGRFADLVAGFDTLLATLLEQDFASVQATVPRVLRTSAAGRDKMSGVPAKDRSAAAHESPSSDDVRWRLPRLVELLTQWEQRLQQDKLDALKELAYGASHEINNPLANISARAQTLLAGEQDPNRRRALAAIHSQALRAHEMISDMMLFARPPKLQWSQVDLVALAQRVIGEFSGEAQERESQLVLDRPGEGAVVCPGDATQLAVALHALCRNALEAVESGGTVRVCVFTVGSRYVAISVQDTGPGLAPRAQRHLFDPFFSGREAGRGLGFGLSKCWRIVQAHGGKVLVESSPGSGTNFTLQLPQGR